MALINSLKELGDKVRTRTGITESMTIEQMGDAVLDIPINGDLSNYYTKGETDKLIEEIELTPGPAGPVGGVGYVYFTVENGHIYSNIAEEAGITFSIKDDGRMEVVFQ